jgi:FkbM family methyltransferase
MKARLVVRVNGGGRMRVDTADVTGRTIAVTGAWEPHVTGVFSRLLSPGDVCIDVGAHVGYYTLLASRLVGPPGHVYAIEPASTTYAELRRNLELNEVSNVTALNLAAGAADRRGILYDGPPGNAGQASMQEPVNMSDDLSARSSEVDVLRVVSVVAPEHHSRVTLVKIDVEGFEFDVLRGLEPLLDAGAQPAVLMELHPGLWGGRDPMWFEEFCARHSLEVVPLFERDRPVPVRLRDAHTFRVDLLDARQDVLLARRDVARRNRDSASALYSDT